MEAIQHFYETTNQLIARLKQDKLDRDVQIEKVQNLLDQREELLRRHSTTFL